MSPTALPPYLEPGRSHRRRRRRRGPFFSRRHSTFASPGWRRRQLPQLPVAWLAMLVAAIAGVGAGVLITRAVTADDGRATAARFAAAWQRGDHAAMYGLVDPALRRSVSRRDFERSYEAVSATATATDLTARPTAQTGDGWALRVRVRTRLFGRVAGTVRLAMDDSDPRRVAWTKAMTFPGLGPGERLTRRTRAPQRAPLLARGGRRLAGPGGEQTELGAATGVVGELGRARGQQLRALVEAGFPRDARVGVSGLQRILDERLRGRPGGTLTTTAGRVLARATPAPAPPLRTSLDPDLQAAASGALAGRFGGIAVLEPRTGEVLAAAGIALDGAQPPGSTFKIVTLSGALEAGLVTRESTFPVQTGADVGGLFVANAHDEACGGDLTESFAKSCNSVFAPMGVKLGARRLVATSERFGFNASPAFPGAEPDVIPKRMSGPADVGSSAIGQGRVLATPLGMARVTAAIANDGRMAAPTFVHDEPPKLIEATSPRVARAVRELMLAVVNGAGATGTSAAIEGGQVAGKTGTAELGGDQPNDAWFVAFAPAPEPELAVAVLVVHGGFGGETAAPIARQVLEAGLAR